jgi:Ca2+-binding EF-hand superfamily protein
MEKIIKALLSDEKKFENAAKTLYAHADLNGDHIIDYKEFKIQFMKISDDLNLGKPTEEEINQMVKKVDLNMNGKIEYNEFRKFLKNLFMELVKP